MAVEIANTSAPSGASNLGKAVGASIGLGAADTAVGGLLGMASARLNYKYNKKLMAQQNQYNIEAFEREKQAVRDMAGLQREGLRQAGYSTADPTNTGIAQLSPDAQGPSGSSMGVNLGSQPNFGAALGAIAQFQNLDSQTRLNNIEAQYRARKLEGEIGVYNAQMDEIRATYPERIKEIQANVQNLVASKQLNDTQASKVLAETDNIKAALQGIQMDSKYAELRNKWSTEKLQREAIKTSQEVTNLLKEGRILEAKAKLADMGIVCGSGLEMLVSAALNGQASGIVQNLADSFNSLMSGAPDIIGSVLGSAFDSFCNLLKNAPAAVVNKIRQAIGK